MANEENGVRVIESTFRQNVKRFLFHRVNNINAFFLRLRGVELGEHCNINRKSKIDGVNPKGVHIGDYVRISQNALILAHDGYRDGAYVNTYIGNHVNIGWGVVVNPGIKIGDHVIVGANAVVTKDIPSHSLVAGNPAKILRVGIELDESGHMINRGEKPVVK